MSIIKTIAVVNGFDDNRYFFQETESNVAFTVPYNIIHKRVIFPSQLLDEDGILKEGAFIHMVKKVSDYNPQLKVMYYPDNSIYKVKDNSVKDELIYRNLPQNYFEGCVDDNYKSLLLDLIDLTIKTATVFLLPNLIDIFTKFKKK